MNKKLLFIVIFILAGLIFTIIPAQALLRGFSPDQYPSEKNFGIGVYFAPKNIKLYLEPKLDSDLIEELDWTYARLQINSASDTIENPEDVFIAFYPYKEIAVMSVIEETDDWVQVIYDHKNNLTGWIYLKTPIEKTQYNTYIGNFYGWFQFMLKIAKKRGIYFLPGVPKKDRKLRGQPKDDSPVIKYDFTYVKRLQIKHIRGNWILVKAYDISEGSPFGWIRWRDENGQLMIFCNLD